MKVTDGGTVVAAAKEVIVYYQGTIAAFRTAVEAVKPGTESLYSDLIPGKIAPLSYLLWMCDQVQEMDTTSADDALKAGRWIGWVSAHTELAGIWDNAKTRDLVREDHKNGFDTPHQE